MIYPFVLCALASFATGLGGIIVVLLGNTTAKTLSVFQGFAAGVMVTISFFEMLPNCYLNLLTEMTAEKAVIVTACIFMMGWLAAVLIGKIVDLVYGKKGEITSSEKISLITTSVMILHNLPEGMLTIFSGFADQHFALEMAVAVALHNIPEGVVVASGVLCITASRKKAVFQGFFAGLCEFIGGVAAVLVFGSLVSEIFLSAVLGVVSGVMVQTSLCQLMPDSARQSSKKHAISGFLLGVTVIYLGIFTI